MPLLTRRETAVLLLDGIVGVCIGAASIGSAAAASPLMSQKAAGFFSASGLSIAMLGVPMFLSTITLAPALFGYLRQQRHLGANAYFSRSATAGVWFGFAASAMTGFFSGLLLPLIPGIDATLGQRLAIGFGAPGLLMMGFGLSSLLFIVQILVFGVAFGLLNGWLLRRDADAARAP